MEAGEDVSRTSADLGKESDEDLERTISRGRSVIKLYSVKCDINSNGNCLNISLISVKKCDVILKLFFKFTLNNKKAQ